MAEGSHSLKTAPILSVLHILCLETLNLQEFHSGHVQEVLIGVLQKAGCRDCDPEARSLLLDLEYLGCARVDQETGEWFITDLGRQMLGTTAEKSV